MVLLLSTDSSRTGGNSQSVTNHFFEEYTIYIINGAFVYRLGHKIFILGRGIRLPYALPINSFSMSYTKETHIDLIHFKYIVFSFIWLLEEIAL